MNERLKHLGEEALKLSPEERLCLVDTILASVQASPPDVEKAWSDEIRARVAAYERGEFELEDAEDVMSAAREALRR